MSSFRACTIERERMSEVLKCGKGTETTLILECLPMVCVEDIVPFIKDAAGCLMHTRKRKTSTLGALNLQLSYIYEKPRDSYKLIGVVESLLMTAPAQTQNACKEIIKYAVVEIHIALYQGKQFFTDVVDNSRTIPTLTCEKERFIENMVTVAFKLVVPQKKITSHHRLLQVRLQQLICVTVAKCTTLLMETKAEDIAVMMDDCSYFSSEGLIGVVKLLESGEGYVLILGRNQRVVSDSTWTNITEKLEHELQDDFLGHHGYSVTRLPYTSTAAITTVTSPPTAHHATKKISISHSSCQPIQETNSDGPSIVVGYVQEHY